jgi:hypothetical protein
VQKMVRRSDIVKLVIGLFALISGAVAAKADTKAATDAWSRGDYVVAVEEWRQPALEGDAEAQFHLGQAYRLGRGVKTDLNTALDWYRKAAAQGHIQAGDNCGHLLHYQKKYNEALPFLIASSDRGEPRAQYLLATELFNGVNIEKDWIRAYAMMTRAASAGIAPASRSLALMDQYIPAEQRQAGILRARALDQSADGARGAQVDGLALDSRSRESVTLAPVSMGVAVSAKRASDTVADEEWRIQLGAFSHAANAKKLWTKIAKDIPRLATMKPILKSDGALTRLQAGPFASKADAEAICKKLKASGQPCLTLSAS